MTADLFRPDVKRSPQREKIAAAASILERELRAWNLLRSDSSIHPEDALAAVVWPPRELLEMEAER
jgi:hypothetical protein